MQTNTANILRLFFLLVFLIFSCEDSEQPTAIITPINSAEDTLVIQIKPGVFTELKNLEDSYSLDDEIEFQIIVYNLSDSNGFYIYYGYLQAYNWVIFDSGNNSVAGGPTVISPAVLERTLGIGDSIVFQLHWNQRIYSHTKGISDLKTYSGNYSLKAQPVGNYLFKPMTKFFSITDNGDPLSVDSGKDYEIEDTLKFEFVLRNRTTNKLSYILPSPSPIEVKFVKLTDTTLIQYFSMGSNELLLDPQSDNFIFEYEAALEDSSFYNLSGVYSVITSIFIENKEYSSKFFEYF